MISSRFALPVALLLILALVPTIIHNYLGLTIDDNLSIQKISKQFGGFYSETTKRNPLWGQQTFDSHDWVERIYTESGQHKIRFFAGRTYDHKQFYHHPELALSYGKNLKSQGVYRLEGEPVIPVHLFRGVDEKELVMYALIYDGQFVESPVLHQFRDSLSLLIGGRRPMTMIYVSESRIPFDLAPESSSAAFLLRAAAQEIIMKSEKNELVKR